MMDEALCAQVALLYYQHNLFGFEERPTQEKIGNLLGIPRAKVNAAKKHAEDTGLVRFTVGFPGTRDYGLELLLFRRLIGEDSRAILNLESVRVIRFPGNTAPDENEHVLLRWMVGQAAAELARELLARIAGQNTSSEKRVVMGMSWGQTLRDMALALRPIESLQCELEIVPTVGGFGGSQTDLESNLIVSEAHNRLGLGKAHSLPVPAYVRERHVRDELRKVAFVEEVAALWEQADIVFSGIGATDPKATAITIPGWLDEDDLRLLEEELGLAGDLCLRYFTRDGTPLEPQLPDMREGRLPLQLTPKLKDTLDKVQYPVSADLTILRDIAKAESRYSIAVGAGIKKAIAFVGAAHGGYIDGLVTDSDTAKRILELWEDSALTHTAREKSKR